MRIYLLTFLLVSGCASATKQHEERQIELCYKHYGGLGYNAYKECSGVFGLPK